MDNQERKQKIQELLETLKSGEYNPSYVSDSPEQMLITSIYLDEVIKKERTLTMGIIERKTALYDKLEGQYELAQSIRKVTNSEEGAIDRLLAIHKICSEAILAYEAIDKVDDDDSDDSDTHGKIIQMDPILVKITAMPTERDIKAQMERLEREGQIEPIALKPDNSPDLTEWHYADAQIMAAIRLGWPTLLFTYDYKDND